MSVVVQGSSSSNDSYLTHNNLSRELLHAKENGIENREHFYPTQHIHAHDVDQEYNINTIRPPSYKEKHQSNRQKRLTLELCSKNNQYFSVTDVSTDEQQKLREKVKPDMVDTCGSNSSNKVKHQPDKTKRCILSKEELQAVNEIGISFGLTAPTSHSRIDTDFSRNRSKSMKLNEKVTSDGLTASPQPFTTSDANPQEDFSLSPKSVHNSVNSRSMEISKHLDNNPSNVRSFIYYDTPIPKKQRMSAQNRMDILQAPSLYEDQSIGITPACSDRLIDECTTSHIKVGTRVSVYWDGDRKYYTGTVRKYIPERKKPYFIRYEDGDKEWLDFRNETFKILDKFQQKSFGDQKLKTLRNDTIKNIKSDDTDWVRAGMIRNDSDTDTDDEEVAKWASKMFGIVQPLARKKQLSFKCDSSSNYFSHNSIIPMSISEKVKLGRRNRLVCSSVPEQMETTAKKETNIATNCKVSTKKTQTSLVTDSAANAKLKKLQARPLTNAEIKSILGDDSFDLESSNWVRRSVRQPSKSSLNAPRVKELLEKLVSNDSDMVVLKMKKYCSDLDTPSIVIDAVLDALEENTNCEALYIQNFNEGMRDEQLLHLMRVLQSPTCKIWCLNIGETYKVQMKTWEKFTVGLAKTNITHMYASEHTITSELKDQIRETIRKNRSKHHYHDDPANLDTIVRCTHCWWNPINTKSLRPFIQRKEYEHILRDAEVQGLRGTMTGANLS